MSVFKRVLCIALSIALLCLTVFSVYAVEYSGSDSYKDGKFYDALGQISLTGNGRTDILKIAESQRYYFGGGSENDLSGTPDSYGKYTEYGKAYGSPNSNWCGFFVSWCAKLAGIDATALKQTGVANPVNFGLTGQSRLKGANAYTWTQFADGIYTPLAGDLIFYGYSSAASYDEVPVTGYSHVGILKEVIYNSDGSYAFIVIEGNTSVSGYDDSLRGVELKTRKVAAGNTTNGYTGYWYIRAFGVPDYEGTGEIIKTYHTGSYTVTAENGLIIRAGTGTDYERLSKIPFGIEVQVTEISSNWGKVTYEGIDGWICLDYTVYNEVIPTLTDLRLESLPIKTEYLIGETLNTEGIKITAVYSDGSQTDVSDACNFSPLILDSVGSVTVTGVYGDKVIAFTVNVTEKSKEIDLSDPSTYPEQSRVLKYVTPIMTGEDVKFIQLALSKLGFELDADGIFGPATENAVKAFQEANLLQVDGKVGPQTWSKIIELLTVEEPPVDDSIYEIDSQKNYLLGVIENTTAAVIIENLGVTADVFDADQNALQATDTVGTGCKVNFISDGVEFNLTVIVAGDLSGDGRLASADFMKIRNSYLERYTLTEYELAAADVSGDGAINSNDFMLIRRHFLGLYNIFKTE